MSTGSGKRVVAITVTVIAVLAVGAGLYLAGSPAEERLRRLDQRRVEDLREASRSIRAFWNQHGHLPPTLDSLPTSATARPRFHDPATGEAYEYRQTGDSTYELCAEFARASLARESLRPDEDWPHDVGRHCFPMVIGRRPR